MSKRASIPNKIGRGRVHSYCSKFNKCEFCGKRWHTVKERDNGKLLCDNCVDIIIVGS